MKRNTAGFILLNAVGLAALTACGGGGGNGIVPDSVSTPPDDSVGTPPDDSTDAINRGL